MTTKDAVQARLSPFIPGDIAQRWLDTYGIERVWVYEMPLRVRFRNIDSRDGLIFLGAGGLAEAAPFWNYDAAACQPWFQGGAKTARDGCGEVDSVPLNMTVPVVSPAQVLQLLENSQSQTVKVKVADARSSLSDDAARLRAVRKALGKSGRIRIDANAAWSLTQARQALPILSEAAAGLEYAEQPCRDIEDLGRLKDYLPEVVLAADESIRLAANPQCAIRRAVELGIDAIVIKAMPLGGAAHAASIVAAARGDAAVTTVVSSALDSGVGLISGMALATRLGTEVACGLGTGALMSAGILVNEPYIEHGKLFPPKDIQLNEDLAPVRPELSQKWRERFEAIAGLACKLGM